ncbi:MAG: flagellar export protein FliJ [Oscillospiraceae bacterium]|nr:flagellar export protein FliJ [Oscillospiraceae bacterium]
MKKFKFALDSVLSYKEQVLESLQGEHAAILAQVREQEEVLEAVWQDYRDCNEEYRQRKEEGLTITDAMVYQNGLRVLERNIQTETEKLEELKKQEEAKRQEVVDAKIDTSSIEKLKDKKLELYNKEVAKSEELLIDEFVSSARARASIGA